MKENTRFKVLAVIAVIAVLAALLLPALFADHEISYIFQTNGGLDVALSPEFNPVVVAGTIKHVIPVGTNMRLPSWKVRHLVASGFKEAIEFHVSAVISGDDTYKDRTLELPLLRFAWPSQLIPLREGEYCILVISKQSYDVEEHYQSGLISREGLKIESVVPAHSLKFAHCDDLETTKNVLGREILDVLKEKQSPERQYELAKLLVPVLAKEDAPELNPYLKNFSEEQQAAIKNELVTRGIVKPNEGVPQP